jgi:hypothetical protein
VARIARRGRGAGTRLELSAPLQDNGGFACAGRHVPAAQRRTREERTMEHAIKTELARLSADWAAVGPIDGFSVRVRGERVKIFNAGGAVSLAGTRALEVLRGLTDRAGSSTTWVALVGALHPQGS